MRLCDGLSECSGVDCYRGWRSKCRAMSGRGSWSRKDRSRPPRGWHRHEWWNPAMVDGRRDVHDAYWAALKARHTRFCKYCPQ